MGREKVMETDKELKKAVEELKAGEEKGFNTIYSITCNFVYARARHMMYEEQEAQDLVQEVYLAVYRNINSLKNVESLYAWLASITVRQGIKMTKKKQHHILLSEEAQGMFEEIPDGTVQMEEETIRKENARILKEILEKLPEEQKSAVILFYYDGLKVEQVAELMEVSAGTIKSRLYLARKRLQEYILELEKRESYSLRGFSVPLLLCAIKMLLEETTLSHTVAGSIYQKVCVQAGIQASVLVTEGVTSKRRVTEDSGKAVGELTKGKGISMNRLLRKLSGLGKVKLAVVAVSTVVVAGAGTATGVYMYQQSQIKGEAQEFIEERQIAGLDARYEKAVELRDNLILEDAVIEILNRDFNVIKTALDEKNADEKTEEKMTTLEKNLEGYRRQNEGYLTRKEAGIMDYHVSTFPQENQDNWDELMEEYQELFQAVKYKAANAKLDEVNAGIMAFLENGNTEVADGGLEETADGTNPDERADENNGDSDSGNGGSGNSEPGNPEKPDNPEKPENPNKPEEPDKPEQTGDFPNGWTYAEIDILNAICNAWFDFKYTEAEARMQLAAQLPGRNCTLVYYPPEQIAEAEALWRSFDPNVYSCSNLRSSDKFGAYFIYGK